MGVLMTLQDLDQAVERVINAAQITEREGVDLEEHPSIKRLVEWLDGEGLLPGESEEWMAGRP